MLKSFRIALLAIAPTVVLSNVALTAEPIFSNAPIAIADDEAICYMVTSDGRTLNLTALCGTSRRGPSTQSGTAAQPMYTRPAGNLGGLDIFGRGPGAPPCFGLDDDGRPCPSSRS